MDIPVVVALIAAAVGVLSAVAGIIAAVITSRRQSRTAQYVAEFQNKTAQDVAKLQDKSAQDVARLQEQLRFQNRQEERLHAALEQLNRYREPLLAAARDVGHRLRNIREESFFAYLHHTDERRRLLALRSTLYRLGRYWAVVESLYESVNELRFTSEEETQRVASLLRDIGKEFASDAYLSPKFMVWREEQRGIADLMREQIIPEKNGVMGFARFMEIYDTTMAPWFAELEQDLQSDSTSASPKLAILQKLFEELVAQLEAGRPRIAGAA